jgi:peptidoglycan hydrolase CwlO-like protein
MTEVTKSYPNGNILTISDDGVSPKEVLKATLTKVYTASDGSTYKEVLVEATDNDLTSDIDGLTKQIAELQARLTTLTAKRTALRAELTKLPEREVVQAPIEEVIE